MRKKKTKTGMSNRIPFPYTSTRKTGRTEGSASDNAPHSTAADDRQPFGLGGVVFALLRVPDQQKSLPQRAIPTVLFEIASAFSQIVDVGDCRTQDDLGEEGE